MYNMSMEIVEIETLLDNAEKSIQNVREMIADYSMIKNETSKQYLLAAINKYAKQFEVQPTPRTM